MAGVKLGPGEYFGGGGDGEGGGGRELTDVA